MAPMDSLPSSPALRSGNLEDELAYYKAQYEQLEAELQDFQASSRELEAELERDIEAAEKKERELQEKADTLGFEVEEWKTKYKQSKTEANNAQNTLQKEITTLRDSNRTLQLKLRDIEVANDDYERQARNTTSSLEDLESKYNVAIERGVILEEEIKVGEQERESLRIEAQRLRDELSDLRIEADIVQEKLRLAEDTIERHHQRKPSQLGGDALRPPSPLSETATSTTDVSSPTISTPPLANSDVSTLQATPPSPPLSDAPIRPLITPSTPLPKEQRTPSISSTTSIPKPGQSTIRPPRHSRGPSIPASAGSRSVAPRNRVPSRPSMGGVEQPPLPRSGSLYQIRGLIGKMQRLEERVHTVRSKLPAPTTTPPRASPRGSALGHHAPASAIPANVTVRSSKKNRTSTSTQNSSTDSQSFHTAPVSRLSFGPAGPRPEPGRPESRQSRPSSRASTTSRPDFSNSQYTIRPSSRTSMSGARTPQLVRPRSSISGTFGPRPPSAADEPLRSNTPGPRLGHNYSSSVSSSVGRPSSRDKNEEEPEGFVTPTQLSMSTNRRATLEKGLSGIPAPSGIPRRQSGQGVVAGGPRRQSSGTGDMGPPPPGSRAGKEPRKLSEVGETY